MAPRQSSLRPHRDPDFQRMRQTCLPHGAGLSEAVRLSLHIKVLGQQYKPGCDGENEKHQYFERFIADEQADVGACIRARQRKRPGIPASI